MSIEIAPPSAARPVRKRLATGFVAVGLTVLTAGLFAEGKHAFSAIVAGVLVGLAAGPIWRTRREVPYWLGLTAVVAFAVACTAWRRWEDLHVGQDYAVSRGHVALLVYVVAGIVLVPAVAIRLYRRLPARLWAVSAGTALCYLAAAKYGATLIAQAPGNDTVQPLFFILIAAAGHLGSIAGGRAMTLADSRPATAAAILAPVAVYPLLAGDAWVLEEGDTAGWAQTIFGIDAAGGLLVASAIILVAFCAVVPAGGGRTPLRASMSGLGVVVAVYVLFNALVHVRPIPDPGEPLRVTPTRVSAPYEMNAFYDDGYWHMTERWRIDDQASAQLREIVEGEWAVDLASAGDVRVSARTSTLQGALTALRANRGAAVQAVRQTLHVDLPTARCVVANCPGVNRIIENLSAARIEEAVVSDGWKPLDVIDKETRFARTTYAASDIPVFGGRTNHFAFPGIDLEDFPGWVSLVPRAGGSRATIRAPKGMIVETFPAASDNGPTLDGKEEQFVVDIPVDDGEVRIRALAWVLRSEPGHLLYRTGQWPKFPLALGLLAGLVAFLLRARVSAAVDRRAEDRT